MGVQKRTGIVNGFCTVSRGDLKGLRGNTADIESGNFPLAGTRKLTDR